VASSNVKKEIRYLGRDFATFRENLINFAKVYFPSTYNDFNESSPGMMFIEMASYVGDVLSYYIDTQMKEMLLSQAEERENVIALSQALGYKPKASVPASTNLDVFQLVPEIGTGSAVRPDYRYALTIDSGMEIASKTNPDVVFRTLDDVDFKASSSINPTTVTVYQVDSITGDPTYYLLKKQVKISAGQSTTETFTFTYPIRYNKIALSKTNVVEILSMTDSDNNTWYEVPYLAQDTMFVDVNNVAANDPILSQYNDAVPYLLKLKKTSRRFISRLRADNKFEIQFGAGVSSDEDEDIIPNPDCVGLTSPQGKSLMEQSFDPSNFLYTKTYGQVPQNTTLTVKYAYGGGISSNVAQDSLTEIKSVTSNTTGEQLNAAMVAEVKNSVAVSNPNPATGGKSKETIEEIRNNALAYFSTQNRAVTKEDYIIRVYSMPPKYGSIAKAYIVQDEQLNASDFTAPAGDDETVMNVTGEPKTVKNPLALNLYTLTYDSDGHLTTANTAIKQNIKTYLGEYRLLTDAINIKDGYTINFGINFSIVTSPTYNKREVILKCIDALKKQFDIKKWQFNEPISISNLYSLIAQVEGVQSVVSVELENKYKAADGYSGNVYDFKEATRNGILYPSMDPSIFELKYPDSDIKGQAVPYPI